MTTRAIVLLLVALANVGATPAQTPDFSSLLPLHQALRHCSAEQCGEASDRLTDALERLLSSPEMDGQGEAPPDFMAALASSDGRLQVFTWNWPHPDRTSGYGGLIAFREERDAPLRFTRLKDLSSADPHEPHRAYDAEEWRGALYYAMVPDEVDKDTWLLLGWDDADAQVTRKLIEPIQVRSRGIRFGAPVLQTPQGMMRRWVLEHADAVQASLRHQPEERGKSGHPERIVFDHLAPNEPHLTGITAYYGPDMTFDAFVPGKKPGAPWQLLEGIEAIQDLPGDRPFVDPRPRNGRRNRR